MGTGAWALIISIIAIALSAVALGYSRIQAHAAQTANVPRVEIDGSRYTHDGRQLTITFTGPPVEHAHLVIVGDGALTAIGAPGGRPDGRTVGLDSPVTGSPIVLPSVFTRERHGPIELEVTIHGKGFRKAVVHVSYTVPPGPAGSSPKAKPPLPPVSRF